MTELLKYMVATFGWFGAFLIGMYFFISKIPSFMEGFNQLTDKKYERLEKILENGKLDSSVKNLTLSILNEEYINRATGSRLSKGQIDVINNIYERSGHSFRIKDVLDSRVISIDTSMNQFIFKGVTQKRKEIFYSFGVIYLRVTLVAFLAPIILIMRLIFMPKKPLNPYLKNVLHFLNSGESSIIIAMILALIALIAINSFQTFSELEKALIVKKSLDKNNISYICEKHSGLI